MEFQPKGLILAVHADSRTYDIAKVIEGHAGNNEGSVDNDSLTLGPCMVEFVSREVVEKNLPNEGRFFFMLREMRNPIAYRYMMLDGQQIIYVSDTDKSGDPFVFQIGHASFRSQQGSRWREMFPEEIWEK